MALATEGEREAGFEQCRASAFGCAACGRGDEGAGVPLRGSVARGGLRAADCEFGAASLGWRRGESRGALFGYSRWLGPGV